VNEKEKNLPSKRVELKILLFILVITLINYFDRSALAFSITSVQNAFNIDNTSFGIIASAFGVGYLVASFFAGFLIDRFGVINTWALAVLVWSITTFCIGLSSGFWTLFTFRLILGLAEAFHFPALLKTITDWLEPYYRSRCVSIGLLGVPLASVIGAPLLTLVIHVFSWRVLFYLLGIVGVIWVVFWLIYFKKIEQKHIPFSFPVQSSEQLLKTDIPTSNLTLLKQMFRSRAFVGNCINYFIFGYIIFFALNWLPGYFQQTFHLDILNTGWVIMIPWIISAIFLILGGFVSDYLWKHTHKIRVSRILPIAFAILLSGISFFLVSYTKSFTADIIFLSLGLGFAFFANSAFYSLNADLFEQRAGTAQGIITAFSAFGGILAPYLTGLVTQQTGSFHSAFYLISFLCISGFLQSIFFQKIEE